MVFETGNSFIQAHFDQESPRQGVCIGYVEGVTDTLELLQQLDGYAGPRVCIPPEATLQQRMLVVIDYMKNHVGELHWPADVIVVNALCRASSGSPTPLTRRC